MGNYYNKEWVTGNSSITVGIVNKIITAWETNYLAKQKHYNQVTLVARYQVRLINMIRPLDHRSDGGNKSNLNYIEIAGVCWSTCT